MPKPGLQQFPLSIICVNPIVMMLPYFTSAKHTHTLVPETVFVRCRKESNSKEKLCDKYFHETVTVFKGFIGEISSDSHQ